MEMGTGLDKIYVQKNNKMLAYGYTTGSCAAAASRGAVELLLTESEPKEIVIMTPKGIGLRLKPELCRMEGDTAICVIRKDSGDDPDVTNGILVWASVKKVNEPGIHIDGGVGVGRITRTGLEQPVGAAAINRIPRKMIRENVVQVCAQNNYVGGIDVVISIPEGVELASRTFNPRLGIEGGISVLGTSGIVEPMSEKALIDSIRVELKQYASQRDYIVVTPGNYGSAYIREHFDLDLNRAVKCSNYVGETIDMAVELGVKGLLFVSHIGKFVKVAGGIMNTHSRSSDCRAEILAAHSILAGCSADTAREILKTITTDEALEIMAREDLIEPAMKTIMEKIAFNLDHRAYGKLELGVLVFSNERGELGRTENFEEIMSLCKQDDQNK